MTDGVSPLCRRERSRARDLSSVLLGRLPGGGRQQGPGNPRGSDSLDIKVTYPKASSREVLTSVSTASARASWQPCPAAAEALADILLVRSLASAPLGAKASAGAGCPPHGRSRAKSRTLGLSASPSRSWSETLPRRSGLETSPIRGPRVADRLSLRHRLLYSRSASSRLSSGSASPRELLVVGGGRAAGGWRLALVMSCCARGHVYRSRPRGPCRASARAVAC